MGQGYVRNDTANNIADDKIASAADLDGEFDAIVSAFDETAGHTHDGTAAEGGPVSVIGPAQDFEASATDFKPKTDSTHSLGTTSERFTNVYTDAVNVEGNITVTGTVDGRDLSADGTKLDNIEDNATADQTGAQIKTAYEAEANTNAFTDAEKTKLSGIETGADVTDTTNVANAGALMESEVTNLADVKAFDPANYATPISSEAELTSALSTGGFFVLTSDFTVTSTLSFSGSDSKDFILDMQGHTITVDIGNNALIDFTNAASIGPSTITAISNQAQDYSQNGSTNTQIDKLTSNSHGTSRGDVLKVFDDTLLPQQFTGNERIGEFVIVGDTTVNEILLIDELRETYSTGANFKFVRPSNSKVIIRNGTLVNINTADGSSGFLFRGFIGPIVENVTTKDFKGPGLCFYGCYMGRVSGYRMFNHENGVEDGAGTASFGYGVLDSSCHGLLVESSQGVKGRHLFTTVQNPTTANDDDWYQRGRSMFAMVTGCIGHGFGAAVFDTHPSAVYTTFENCIAYGSYRGYNSGGEGFQIRSASAVLRGCQSVGCRYGAQFTRTADETEISNITLEGFISDGDEASIRCQGASGGIINVYAPTFEARNVTGDVLQDISYSEIEISFLKVKMASNANSFAETLDIDNDTIVRIGKMRFDIQDSAQTDHRLGQANGSNVELYIDSCEIYQNGTDRLSSYFQCNSNDVVFWCNFSKDTTDAPDVVSVGASSDIRITERSETSPTVQNYSQFRVVTVSGGASNTIDLGDAADQFITVRIENTSSSASTFTDIGEGKYNGQRMTLVSRNTSVGNIVISSSTFVGSTDITFAAEDAATFVWFAGSWIPVEK